LGYASFADLHHRVLLQVEIVFYYMEMASQRSQNHSWIGREGKRLGCGVQARTPDQAIVLFLSSNSQHLLVG
jgi:hypothetical protein